MNPQEKIRRILREEGFIPLPIRRRVTSSDLEEAFYYALETNVTSMDNPNSVIYKEKKPSLWVFSKFVIDDMVTLLEQEYFTNDNRIYFSDTEEDDKTYHKKIRQPLLRYYGKRIKEKYDEIMSSNDEELIQESIRRILREEVERNYIFVRTDDFDNTGTVRELPYDGIHCWCIYEDDFDKYIDELELWGGSRKKVRIVDGENYKKYATNYKMAHDYVMGDSDEIPKLEKFNPDEHIMKFIKQGKKSMLNYVANMKYQIILI